MARILGAKVNLLILNLQKEIKNGQCRGWVWGGSNFLYLFKYLFFNTFWTPIFAGAPDMDGLRVIQTPKGISLREAIWEADAIQRQPNTAQPGGSISPTGFLFQSLPSPSEKQAQHQHQQPPMSPWEALISNLATAEGSSVTVPWTTTQSEGAQQAQQESDLLGGIRPSSAAFRTPPTVPALHAAPAPPTSTAQGTLATRFSLPPLQLPTEVTDATLAESHSSPSPLGLLHSPAPLLTPGAPPSVPLELRAEAAERLWPLLAPFAPRILRDDILRPAEQRRFVRPAEKSGYFGRRSGDPELSSTPSAPWLPSGLRMDSEMEPEACTFQAAVAVADVSGFTALTEVLSRAGPSGVELLTRCMNSYFAQVIDVVTQHGGDVVKFAGDAIIIVFEPTKEETETGEDGGLAAATRRAAAASLELIDKYGEEHFLTCALHLFLILVRDISKLISRILSSFMPYYYGFFTLSFFFYFFL